jgi:hypothetical protein
MNALLSNTSALVVEAIDHAGIQEPTWEGVKAAALAAWAAFEHVVGLSDPVKLGRELSDAEEAAYQAALQVRNDTIEAVCAFPVAYGQVGDKLEVLRQVEHEDADTLDALHADYARLAEPAAPCPVLALMPQLEEAGRMEMELDDLHTWETPEHPSRRWGDRRDEIEGEISRLQATSVQGALAQIMISLHTAELVRGNIDQNVVDDYHTELEGLLTSALTVLGGCLPDIYYDLYFPGERPEGQSAVIGRDAVRQRLREQIAIARWEEARAAFVEAKAAYGALTTDEIDADEAAGNPVYNRYMDALEAFEAAPPPTLAAMVEMMRASINEAGGVTWSWDEADQPETMRDLLDGGEPGDIFTARYFMHALRLAGQESPALSTVPIAGLYPPYTPPLNDGTHEEAEYRRFHAEAQPRPGRADELMRWRRAHGVEA